MGFDTAGYYVFLYLLASCTRYLCNPSLLILGGGLLFYISLQWQFLPLLILATAVAYFGGLSIAKRNQSRSRWGRLALLLCCGLVYFPLFIWKFFLSRTSSFLMPLGLSFYTFHCVSYLIDVYRGTVLPERSFKKILLYVSFFPQLIAGPLTRAQQILPQFENPKALDTRDTKISLWRIYLGLFKKFTIANVLGPLSAGAFAQPLLHSRWTILAAVLAGRYFIYADFSGYTDIAVGSARLLGIRLPENFERPFSASSLADYWRRWHMTLQAWIRDYVFLPLVGSPLSVLGTYPLLILTFVMLGLWHGASLNFLFYGLWHGCFLAALDFTRNKRLAIIRRLKLNGPFVENWVMPWATFLLLVCPPTVLFLTESPQRAMAVVRALVNTDGASVLPGITHYHVFSVIVAILLLEGVQWLSARKDISPWIAELSWPRFTAFAALLLTLFLVTGKFASGESFLYFHF